VVVLASLAPVISCVRTIFHPNDLLAMGLMLGAVACCISSRWAWAGVFIGSACMAHQFALLVAVPLLVLAPSQNRARFVVGAAVTAATIAGSATALAGWGVVHAIMGNGASYPADTLVDHLGLEVHGLVVVSRIVPLIAAGLLAAVAAQRIGRGQMTPPLLCSLVAVCLGLRLLFEVNLYGYYLAACAVMLLAVEVIGGRVRWTVVAWLLVVALVFPIDPHFNWFVVRQLLPVQVIAVMSYLALVAPSFVRACRQPVTPAGRAEIW
jgi:hypothetical protein